MKELEKESGEMTAVWRKELGVIQAAKELNEKIEITKMKAAKAQVRRILIHSFSFFSSLFLFFFSFLSFLLLFSLYH
jgi:hypothetical protein